VHEVFRADAGRIADWILGQYPTHRAANAHQTLDAEGAFFIRPNEAAVLEFEKPRSGKASAAVQLLSGSSY
jgi:hypothetical protein